MEESESQRNPTMLRTETMVIRSTTHSMAHTLTAMTIWLGAIHLNTLLVLASFLCGSNTGFLILGLLILLMVVPVNDKSKLGQAVARYVGKYAPGYFPVTVHIEDAKAFDQNKAYVLAAEPHSVFPIGCLALLNITGIMPLSKTKALASSAVFYTPFLRQISTWLGLVPASKENFVRYLEAGHSCIIIPGGVHEIAYMNNDYEVAFLRRRYGFVRVAIETGSPLVPVFCFGQSDGYKWWKPEGKLYVHIARTLRFAPLFFWGPFGNLWALIFDHLNSKDYGGKVSYFTGKQSPIPYRKPMHIIVGRPIEFKQNRNPSKEEIAEVHGQFVYAMEKLFLKYREVTGHPDMELRII